MILLHGWPYDIHSYVDVAPLLAAAGYQVIIPYLRGYGDRTPVVGPLVYESAGWLAVQALA